MTMEPDGLMWFKTQRPKLAFEESQLQLYRLTDDESVALRRCASPILHNDVIRLRRNQDTARIELPRALIVLERTLGCSSRRFDHDRGSFAFPLLLKLREHPSSNYLLWCHDNFARVYLSLYRIGVAEKEGPLARDSHQVPVEGEFSSEDIRVFKRRFYEWLLISGTALKPSNCVPFFRTIRNEMVLYGCSSSQFFEREFEDFTDYNRAYEELKNEQGARAGSAVQLAVHSLIDKITDSNGNPHMLFGG